MRLTNKGFTLMELMIVMVILSILVVIATGTYTTSTKRGRDNRRKNDLRNITTALESYYSDKGAYPSSNAAGEIVGCGTLDSQACSWGGQFKDMNNTLYMVLMPTEPKSSQKYFYVSTGTTYALYAKLENIRDAGSGIKQEGYTGTNCSVTGTALCTYGIASTNNILPTPQPTP